jgi:hypothetical protein
LEEYVKRESDEPLDEVELREAEEYLNSPEARFSARVRRRVSLLRAAGSKWRRPKGARPRSWRKHDSALKNRQLRKAESER